MPERYTHELQAGDRYAGLDFTITTDLNQQFLYAVEDFNPLYIDSSDGRPALIHPVALIHMTPRTRSPSFRQAPGMGSALARDSGVYLAPARVDTPLHVEG